MLKIASAQMEIQPGRPDANTENMLRQMEEAKANHADIVIFPEMAIPGYLLGDTWEQDAFLRDCESCAADIIAASHGIAVIFGSVAVDWTKKNNDGRPRKYNACFVASEGKLCHPEAMPYPFVIKTLLPNYREFDDTRHFFSLQKLARELGTTPKSLISPVSLKIHSRRWKIGCLLCEDGWSDNYETAPMKLLEEYEDLDFYVNISSSPYTLGKNEKRQRLFSAAAKAAGAPLIYVNNVGLQNNGKTVYTFDGASAVYSAEGLCVAAAPSYEEGLHYVDVEEIASLPARTPEKKTEIAQIYEALSYGVRKFLDSIRMKKVVVGASGGIDSAVAAALYTSVLGAENVLLVNMPSRFNSETTKDLAHALAENLGCYYAVFPIEESVQHTMKQIAATPIELLKTGEKNTLAVSSFLAENIQARDRSSRILAALAAAFGGGFSCNANKAETSVGYSTLYGDQAGFLAALADLWKHQVYDLARYMNEHIFKREVVPQATIDIVPSAELSDAQNVDEGKGDPLLYPYHDYLFRAFVERWGKATPEDILDWYVKGTLEQQIGCEKGLVKKYFQTPKDFIADLERWWNLFSGLAVAKRIQAPPILAVSRRAYGFDHREAQNGAYYTRAYRKLKEALLK